MLAQGKFTEFLKANSDERSKILRKIFNEDSYQLFQDLLKRTREKLAGERKEKETVLDITMKGFEFPPDMGEEEKQSYIVSNDGLIPNMKALIENEKQAEQKRSSSSHKTDRS